MPKDEATNRPEIEETESTISRRSVLKIGAAVGAAGVLAPHMMSYQEALGFEDPPTEPVRCDPQVGNPPPPQPPSPATTPFMDNFTAPFPAIPTDLEPAPQEFQNQAGGEAPRDAHQRWAQFQPEVEYHMIAKPGLHKFHAQYADTYIWGFNGKYPAPTVLNVYGHPTVVRFRNNLPLVTSTFGRNEITIHLHNGHHGSESDGFAGDFFGVGFWKDNLYPNCYAGLDAFGGNGDPKEKMGSFWFHDHRAEFTLNNNVLGLNGMFIVYDNTDPGHEFNTSGSLRLPGFYGITDFPLILTDKRFCATANGRTEMVNAAGGDKFVVNGKIQPKMTVRRRKYRFRILNTGPTKVWTLNLVNPDGSTGTMTCVATDANFLQNPLRINTTDGAANSNATTAPIVAGGLKVAVAERYDIIIDFSQYTAGQKVYLRENAAQGTINPSPDPLPPGLNIANVILQFNVVEREWWFPPDTPAIPSTLATYPTLPPFTKEFEWQFVRDPACPVGTTPVPPRLFRVRRIGDGPLGCAFDAEHPAHAILRGTTERWLINNFVQGAAWAHPIHIHFEEFRTLGRFVNGVPAPVPPLMSGRKDVTFVEAGQGSIIQMQFRDYNGRYLIHCHNMAHEDAFMMVRWDICPTPQALLECQAELQVCNEVQQCVPNP